jgi:thiol-disulfide isomerase/thioredoxin
MAGLYDLFKRFLTPYYSRLIVVFLFSIFSIAGYYLYKNSSDNKSKILDEIHQPKDDINTGKGGSASESGGSGGSADKKDTSAPGKLNIFYIALICLGSIFFVGLIWVVYVKGFGGADDVNVSSLMKTMFAIALTGTAIAAVNIYIGDIQKPWIDSKKYKKNYSNKIVNPVDTLNVYFFTADWCPHCRNAKPEIDNFEKEYNDKQIHGHTIKIIRVDCTDSEETSVAEQINKFSVTSFPTVKIADGNGNKFEFDAKITKDNLVGFVESVANN